MSCGCGKVAPNVPSMAMVQSANRARAIMCQTCIYGERTDSTTFGLAVVSCDGVPIAQYITGFSRCPKEKHPDQYGVVRWLGIRWFGVPKPLRMLMRPWLTGDVQGCGCIARLKTLWLKIQGKLGKSEVSHATH